MSRLKSLLASLPPLTIPLPSIMLETFTLFPELAPEIRHMIWTLTSLSPRKVNLLSTLSDPEPRLKSTIPGQTRQPAVLEVNKESRTVGKRVYELVQSGPRPRCVAWARRREDQCLRCFFDAWNAEPGRGYANKSLWSDEEIDVLPAKLKMALLRRDNSFGPGEGIWVLPSHQEYQDVKGDLHWINFDRDDFVLKLPTGFQTMNNLERRCQFNFGLDVAKRIRQLEACSVPDMLKMQGLRWVLSGMLQWPQLQKVQICLHREGTNNQRNDPMAFGALGLELKKTSVYPVLKSYLGKGMSKEVRAKICMKETVAVETKEKWRSALLDALQQPWMSTSSPRNDSYGTLGAFPLISSPFLQPRAFGAPVAFSSMGSPFPQPGGSGTTGAFSLMGSSYHQTSDDGTPRAFP